jgi:hypothetical protein
VIPIELDRPRNLKFDLKALKDLEAAMGGKPLMAIIQDVMGIGVTAISVALWAGLKHEDPTLTIPLATKILQAYLDDKNKSMKVLGRALGKAFEETGLLKGEDEELEGNEQATAVTA